jgi:hypothetical protein
MRNTAEVTGGKPIAVLLQSISGVSAINPLVAFYDIHGGKREVLFFYFVPDTTRDLQKEVYKYVYIRGLVSVAALLSLGLDGAVILFKDIISNIFNIVLNMRLLKALNS